MVSYIIVGLALYTTVLILGRCPAIQNQKFGTEVGTILEQNITLLDDKHLRPHAGGIRENNDINRCNL